MPLHLSDFQYDWISSISFSLSNFIFVCPIAPLETSQLIPLPSVLPRLILDLQQMGIRERRQEILELFRTHEKIKEFRRKGIVAVRKEIRTDLLLEFPEFLLDYVSNVLKRDPPPV